MIYQGHSRELPVWLQNAGSPATGIVYTDVTVEIRKAEGMGFLPKPLETEEWYEIGDGWYALTLSEDDVSVIGPLLIKLSGVGFDTAFHTHDVEPVPFGVMASNEICIISGNISDLGGDPKWQVPIVFRPVELPTSSSGSLITGDPIRTVCDVYGNFYVMLIRGKKAIVEIGRTGVKHTIIVPDQETANIIDLLPPLE